MKLPIFIEKCPIVDALIEIRFESEVNTNAVFGLIYGAIIQNYPGSVVNLPIMQLPEAVREKDPALKFKPLYRINNKNIIIQIGPDVICISSPIPYIGWSLFKQHVCKILYLINTNGAIIKKVTRIGHRYANFFDNNMLNNITMGFNMTDGYDFNNIMITTQVKDNDFQNTIQFSNSAIYNQNKGSIIDIDTFKQYSDNYFLENAEKEIEKAHQCEKKLFFSLLKADFIESLNPKY